MMGPEESGTPRPRSGPTEGEDQPMTRCTRVLEAKIPDIPQHVDHTLVLQCTKEAGHTGQHRTQAEPVFWTEE